MTKLLLKKAILTKPASHSNNRFNEMTQFLQSAAKDLLQPRQEVIDRILEKAHIKTH
jgi:hypothetical protein